MVAVDERGATAAPAPRAIGDTGDGNARGSVRRAQASGRTSPDAALRSDLTVALALYVAVLVVYLLVVAAVNRQGRLTDEEASVSFADVVALTQRFQLTHFATNFGSHVLFWAGSHLDPWFGLFYGRTVKAVMMATLAPLLFWTLRRRLSCRLLASAVGGLLGAILPGVLAFSWIATEFGLEAVPGMLGLLLVTSRRRGWWLAPLLAGASVSLYGAGLAWAAPILVAAGLRAFDDAPGRRVRVAKVGWATAGALLLLFLPLWWWGGGTIVVGGGAFTLSSVPASAAALARELFWDGRSYYSFSTIPALSSALLGLVLLGGLAWGCRRLPAFRLWGCVWLAAIAVMLLSGGVGGQRRAVAVTLGLALGGGYLIDRAQRSTFLGSPYVRGSVVAGLCLALLVPPAVQAWRYSDDLASGRPSLPIAFPFPQATANEPMLVTLERVAQLRRTGSSWEDLAKKWEGVRTASMLLLLAEHRVIPPVDVSGDTVEHLYREWGRCESECVPTPGGH